MSSASTTQISSTALPKVLIVGAGPSGLIAALSLVRNGIPVRIIDKSFSQAGQRGAAIMPRSLEVFQFLGFYDEINRLAIPMPLIRAYKLPGGKETLKDIVMLPEVDPTPDVAFPNVKFLGQQSLRNVVLKHLGDARCTVEFGIELRTLEDRGDEGVHVGLLHHKAQGVSPEESKEEERVTFEYVIGADGAKGVVRKSLGLTFLGQSRLENFVIGDVFVEGLSNELWHQWGSFADTIVSLRPTEIRGVYQLILGGSNFKNHEKILASREALTSFIREHCGNRDDFNIKKIDFLSHYIVQTRMTETFNKGRICLVGDACHVHSPFGGQGMNSGIQDSFNLCWKLALVLKNYAPQSLLLTYSAERLPVISEMLDLTSHFLDRGVRQPESASAGWVRTGATKQLGVNYRSSPIVLEEGGGTNGQNEKNFGSAYHPDPSGVLRAGDRAPDASGLIRLGGGAHHGEIRLFKLFNPTRHTILLFVDRLVDGLPASRAVLDEKYPDGLVRTFVIASPGLGKETLSGLLDGGFEVFEDVQKHACNAYFKGNAYSGSGIVVVRPDGVIGARLNSLDRAEDYFKKVFD